MEQTIVYQRLSRNAQPPLRGSENAAGLDLRASEQVTVPPKTRRVVKTGLRFIIPYGYYGRLASRSGLAVKRHIDIGAGVIDRDFTGEVGVIVINNGSTEFLIEIGDRICQIVFERILEPGNVKEHSVSMKLQVPSKTARATSGFGSTGKK